MDNQGTESSSAEVSNTALNIDGGAQAFAAFLDPQEAPEKSAQELEQEAIADLGKQSKEAPEVAHEPEVEQGTITIKVDGKDVTLTPAQLEDVYKNGLRQTDYTRKTMEVAEQRKAAEAEIQKTQQERQAYASNLQKLQTQIEGALDEQMKIDWEHLLENNPGEYLKQQHLYQRRQAAWQENQQRQQQLAMIAQNEQQQHFQSHLQSQQQELLAKLPDWKDETKAKAESDAIRNYLLGEGFSVNDVDNIGDHKAIILGRKAMLYDAMMKKANAAVKKVAEVPQKVIRPGVGGNSQESDKDAQNMRRLSKTGRVEDAAALFAKYI